MNSRNILRNLTNEESLDLLLKGKAERIETFRSGRLWCPYRNKYISADTRDVIKFKNNYYIRDRYMNYELMVENIAYGLDGSKREVKI